MSLNKVMLIGNVGKDPEVRYLDSNNSGGQSRKVARFPLATTERFKDKELTEWHNIVAWGQSADIAERFVKKGTQLYIEGRIRTNAWTDQSGNKRYTTEINVDNLQLLGRRDDQGASPAPAGGQSQYQSQRPSAGPSYQAPDAGSFASRQSQAPAADIDSNDNPDDLPF